MRLIFVSENGERISEHDADALTELFGRSRTRIRMDLAKAEDAGRIRSANDDLRDEVGAEHGDLVYVVTEGVLNAVRAQEAADEAHRWADERRQAWALHNSKAA